ncbi:MAG: RNA polymerase sigma factor [Pseudomonadota bacterium]
MDEEDAALLNAVCEDSERAFNMLIDRHQQAVRAFLRRLTSRDEADDVAQETFLVAWRDARLFRGQSSVRSWLFSIAWRKAKDGQRRWFRGRQRDTAYLEMSSDSASENPIEARVALDQAFDALPLQQRASAMLCLAHGFSHAEAAEALAIPLGTVKSHVARGRERLLEALGEK